MKLTAPQLRVLRYYAAGVRTNRDAVFGPPRRDVRGRLVQMGLLSVRTAMVHTGTTYRSKQRLAVVDVYVTDAGRALLAEIEES